jgi:DNA (cytosine-5)-methyltransferase 1
MSAVYGVVDLFAGPGGLAEGFSKVEGADKSSPFRIELSIEMEASAHRTLQLRSFLRQFEGGYPPDYYCALNEDRSPDEFVPELARAYPIEWLRAETEALQLELGKPENEGLVNAHIDRIRGDYGSRTILIGGPPCQAYSLVGRSRNMGIAKYVATEDHRHYLYREYIRILERLQPAVFVMENVKGILSSTLDGMKVFNMVLHDLEQVSTSGGGYRLLALAAERQMRLRGHRVNSDFVVRAERFGVPQARHRVIVVGIREDLAVGDLKSGMLKESPETHVRDVIGSMPALRAGLSRAICTERQWREVMLDTMASVRNAVTDDSHSRRIDALMAEFRSRPIPPQSAIKSENPATITKDKLRSWLVDDQLGALPNHNARNHMRSDLARYFFAASFEAEHGRSPKAPDYPASLAPKHRNWTSGKFVDRFRVQGWDNPSTTVTSHISKDGHYFIHPDPLQCRSLTVREAARLQTFPDNYLFLGKRTQQFVQVGNAVPPYLAKQIGDSISQLLKASEESNSRNHFQPEIGHGDPR